MVLAGCLDVKKFHQSCEICSFLRQFQYSVVGVGRRSRFLPPHSADRQGCRNSRVCAGGISRIPSGFARCDASFAMNFVPARPTDAGRPVRSRMRSRICLAISIGSPKSLMDPATSRNASSMLSGSDEWRELAKHLHHFARRDAILFIYRGDENKPRGHSCDGSCDRHGRSHPGFS